MEIFKLEPFQWGLRGDPELWKELSVKFENYDDSKSESEFRINLEFEFNELLKTGTKRSEDVFWFERFSQQGMSGGSVSLAWWINKGIPLLVQNYSRSQKR